ncbi:receptor-type tyrosine-protein phosphatase F-like isoform X2 [Zophobas morio]|uniref:receptor-type tyrosine-protein phosphatase F-like isoform X2 n=1 Tax=Zophobas morio TaxID=2755281 RepID=UPI003083012A
MKLFLYNYVFASVLILAEVITLIKDSTITCVLTDDSVNSTIYVTNKDNPVELKRIIQEITNIHDDDWQRTNSSINFRPVLDQRWTTFSADIKDLTIKNRFSLCLKQHSTIVLHNIRYKPFIKIRNLNITTYSACQWRHYEIMKNRTHVSLVNTENNNVVNVTKLDFKPAWIIFSPYNLNIKVHKYEFRYSTTTSTKPSYISITSLSCVSFYVSVDEGCYLDISVQPANSTTKIAGFNEKNKLKRWKKYEIRTDPKAISQTLSIVRGRDDNGTKGYWAIDDIHTCSSEIVTYRTDLNTFWTNQTCAELNSTGSVSEFCDNATLGKQCHIKCDAVFGLLYPNCENHRICVSENKCHCAWGFRGENCTEECVGDSWGLDCSKNCTNCEKCDKKTGCQKCKSQYFGEQCVYKFPVVKRPPILEPTDDDSIRILTNIEYGQDEEKAEHYYIQWRKLESNDGFENYTDQQFPITKNNESLSINFSRDDSYQFRIILVSPNSSFQQGTIPELIVYKKSLTAHVEDDDTIVLNWTRHETNTYKITHKCQKIFCSHEAMGEYNTNSTTSIELTIKHFKICSIKLFITNDGSNEFIEQTTVIPQNSMKEILPAELPKNVTFLKDQIVLELNKCDSFTGPLNYSIELICISEWCTNKSTKLDSYHLLNYSTNITRDVKGLSPFTEYSITVTAKRIGQHDKIQTYLTKSMPSAPQPVNTSQLYSNYEDTLIIRWKEAFPPTGKIEAYNFTLSDNTSILTTTNRTSSCEMWPEFQCTNIRRKKKVSVYKVTVQAKNYGVAEWSEPINFNIEIKNVTEAPQNLRIELSPQSTDEVILRWEYPPYTYGKIEKFYTVLRSSRGTENNTIQVSNVINYNKTIKIKYGNKYKFTARAQNAHDGEKATIYFVVSKPISKLSNETFILWCRQECYLVKSKSKSQVNTNYNITIKQHNEITEEHETKGLISLSKDKISCTENNPPCDIHSKFQDVASQSYFLKVDGEEIPIEFTAPEESKIASKTNIIVIAAVVLSVIPAAFLLGFLFYRRKSQKYIPKKLKNTQSIKFSDLKEKEALMVNNNESDPSYEPVKINHFANFFSTALDDDPDDNIITRQFEAVPRARVTNCQQGQLYENANKNRYNNVLPYDDTRVILQGNSEGDYINANYINGYDVPKAFIATQAPLASTVYDFWYMIWQENVKIIVMLTEIEENGRVKSEKYWPEDNSRFRFGDFVVESVTRKSTSHYIHREFQVIFNKQSRLVDHFQYTAWPDHGVPLYVSEFVAFVKNVLKMEQNTPVVVHCNAGCGRTGTFILCDILIKMGTKEKQLDFFGVLKRIRDQRAGLVSNIEQYIFSHQVILEYFFGEGFSISISNNFEEEVQNALIDFNIKHMLKCLTRNKRPQFKTTAQLTDEEKSKNRFSKILPGPTQIYLPISSRDSSNYINAVTVDAYQCPKKFIVTQQPLPNTVGDFWKLVHEYEIDTILSLNTINDKDVGCPKFWPNENEGSWTFNSMKLVFLNQETDNPSYNLVRLKVRKTTEDKTKNVIVIDLKNWRRKTLKPSNIKDLIHVWQKIMTCKGKIVVSCYDGATASGLFVALAFVLEKINLDNCCDVFTAVRTVKQSRAQFVEHTEQLRYLYQVALEYIREFNTYQNFT